MPLKALQQTLKTPPFSYLKDQQSKRASSSLFISSTKHTPQRAPPALETNTPALQPHRSAGKPLSPHLMNSQV